MKVEIDSRAIDRSALFMESYSCEKWLSKSRINRYARELRDRTGIGIGEQQLMSPFRFYGRGLAFLLAGIVVAMSTQAARAAEVKTYLVTWFTLSTYSQDGDCPDGLNDSIDGIFRTALKASGTPPDQIEHLLKNFDGVAATSEARQKFVNRGRIDGKPVSIYANPTSLPDPHLHTVQGHYSFGFNLDGKGAASPGSFEDPETHERGINNQLFRAVGCSKGFRAKPPIRSYNGGEYQWGSVRKVMPAWLISIAGEDLSKDGDVTITFERALEAPLLDGASNAVPDMTFRVSSDPRWHNVFHGKIEKGAITATMAAEFHMLADSYYVREFNFRDTRLRLTLKPDGSLDGLLGGYMPWRDYYWSIAGNGLGIECCDGLDTSGLFYALRKLADAYPDPKTGENTAISTAYRVEAIPALIVRPKNMKTASADQQTTPQR